MGCIENNNVAKPHMHLRSCHGSEKMLVNAVVRNIGINPKAHFRMANNTSGSSKYNRDCLLLYFGFFASFLFNLYTCCYLKKKPDFLYFRRTSKLIHFTFGNNNNNPSARITAREATEQKLNILFEWPYYSTSGILVQVKVRHSSASTTYTQSTCGWAVIIH